MSRSRLPLYLSLGAAGGIGYYLYSAGGSPKVAEKRFESDVHRAAAAAKSELPHRGANAEAHAKNYGQEAGAKIDSAIASMRNEASQAKSKAESYAKGLQADASKQVDKAAGKVQGAAGKVDDGAEKAKAGGVSSWFGGK